MVLQSLDLLEVPVDLNGVGKAFRQGLDVLAPGVAELHVLEAPDTHVVPFLYGAIEKRADPIDLGLIRIVMSTG